MIAWSKNIPWYLRVWYMMYDIWYIYIYSIYIHIYIYNIHIYIIYIYTYIYMYIYMNIIYDVGSWYLHIFLSFALGLEISGAPSTPCGISRGTCGAREKPWLPFVTRIDLFIELDDGKIYRKTPYFMGKSMVSCRFSLKPTHWFVGPWGCGAINQHCPIIVIMNSINITLWLWLT